MLLQQQNAPAGQDLPGADSTTTTTTPPAPQPTSNPSAAQFASKTLASLLSAQEAPPSSADVAAKVITAADTNGDGTLSLNEVESALGADTTTGADASSSADALGKAFASVDTNGDGQISADELSTALDGQKAAQGAHHGHHAHHAHAAPSSSDLASQILGVADANGDGELSASEIGGVLGSAAGDLTSAVAKLDTNGDGQLSATELSSAIDAFRTAHHWGGAASATQSPSAQAVTA